ncbi:peptidylprolyl isomerase [soil metagenome]
MKFTRIAAGAACFVLFGIGGCDMPQSAEESQVANADEAPERTEDAQGVDEKELELYLTNRFRKPLSEVSEEEQQQVAEELRKLELVAEEAEKRGIGDQPDIAARLSLERKRVLAQALIQKHLEENPVTEEELRAEYESQLAESTGQEYKARHILLKTKEEAEEVIDQLDEGADFAELATDKSTGPSAPDGGDLGWFTADRMVEPFAEAVAKMEKGTYSKEPVETQFGWHVILNEDTRDATPPAFETVKDQLRPVVEQRRVEKLVQNLEERYAPPSEDDK